MRQKESVCECALCCISPHPGATLLVPAFRDAGLRIILSNMLTISGNFGRAFLSFCQQSSISWCSTTGQSMGAGSRKSCSMAFITWDMVKEGRRRKKGEGIRGYEGNANTEQSFIYYTVFLLIIKYYYIKRVCLVLHFHKVRLTRQIIKKVWLQSKQLRPRFSDF